MSHYHRRAKSVTSTATSSIKTNYGFENDNDDEILQAPTPYLDARTLAASNSVSSGGPESITRTAPVLQMQRLPPPPPPPSIIPAARDPEVSFDGDESVTPSTVLRFPGRNKKAIAIKEEVSESASSASSASEDDDEIDLIIEETKDQKKARVKKEKAEVDKLLKKQKKKINKCVSCIIIPLGGLVLLKRVFESLF